MRHPAREHPSSPQLHHLRVSLPGHGITERVKPIKMSSVYVLAKFDMHEMRELVITNPQLRKFRLPHLYRGSVGNGFIRVYLVVKLLPIEKVRQQLLYFGDPCRSSDQYHLIDLGLGQARILQH